MNRIFRTLLLWLIAVALPIQATAAIVKASCGSSHHAEQAQGVDAGHGMQAHAHDHGQPPMHDHLAHTHDAPIHHDLADADVSADAVAHAADASMSDGQADHDNSTCSACAVCCVGAAAPPAAAIPTFDPDFLERSLPGITSRLTGHIPPSLERPPRSILV